MFFTFLTFVFQSFTLSEHQSSLHRPGKKTQTAETGISHYMLEMCSTPTIHMDLVNNCIMLQGHEYSIEVAWMAITPKGVKCSPTNIKRLPPTGSQGTGVSSPIPQSGLLNSGKLSKTPHSSDPSKKFSIRMSFTR